MIFCRENALDFGDQPVEEALALEFDRVRRAALQEAFDLIMQPRSRIWTPDECAIAVRGLAHPLECSCHRWVDCGSPRE